MIEAADQATRFEFGANWQDFLSVLDDERIEAAMASLREYLRVDDLAGCRFLDIGSGSGLFSLAARKLGASVVSFDYDEDSVACTMELRRRFFPNDEDWRIERGSALDGNFLSGLGKFDVVYSWGVLHHTGAMWVGIENAVRAVNDQGGKLFLAIYNDQGWKSHLWWFVKRLYVALPGFLKSPYVFAIRFTVRMLMIVKYTLRGKPMVAIRPMLDARRERGMNRKHDAVDWIGGFPYEVARFDVLVNYFSLRGFEVLTTREDTGLGCHELAFFRPECAD